MNHTNSNPNPVASFSRQKRKASDAIQFKRSDYEQIVDLCSDDEVVEAISGINLLDLLMKIFTMTLLKMLVLPDHLTVTRKKML